MKQVEPIEYKDHVIHIYLHDNDISDGWDNVPMRINNFKVKHRIFAPIATMVHYDGLLISPTFAEINGYEDEDDTIGLSYMFSNIDNMILCINTADCNKDEAKSMLDCISHCELATAENVRFGDPEWTYNKN